MTTNVPSPQQPRSTASWREAAMARSEIITDAWEVTKTYAGRIAEWVLFACMIMNIIEILPGVTLWPSLSNIVLGTQVVMLDVGGFSLASMGDHARQQGDEQAARRASITGAFLIGIMILTLLLVSIGLLWPLTRPYTNMAEKGLILVRVIMTVIYGHVIHSLRRATTNAQPTPSQIEALTATFNQQLSSELSRVQENLHRQLSTLRESFHRELSSELSPVHESLQQYQEMLSQVPLMKAHIQHIESTTVEEVRQVKAFLEKQLQGRVAEREKRAERPVLHALPPVQQGNNESRTLHEKDTHQVTPQATAGKFDARAFVFACLEKNPALKLAEIEQRARAAGQALSQPTASRYRKQFLRGNESATVVAGESSTMKVESAAESFTMKVQGADKSTLGESSATDERRVVGE